MKITCIVVGTESYLFAINPCLRRIRAAEHQAKTRRDIDLSVILVTDKGGANYIEDNKIPFDGVVEIEMSEGGIRYGQEAQLLIANLQQVGLAYAIEQGSDLCWSVESDVLVPHNALSCSLDMLDFDDGYYDVSFVTYPSQSGGMFLGGYGSPQHPIEQDFLPEERDLPEEIAREYEETKAWLDNVPEGTEQKDVQERADKFHALVKDLDKYPPKGNVFELNGKKWRRRGWMDHAYPGIGRGAVLPTDWTGMGCTLMSRRAMNASSFDGYDGGGTQDLFLNQRRWAADDLKSCVITHTVCEHVVAKNDEEGRRVHAFAHHEAGGECKGHLRIQHRPYYKFDGTDKYDQKNDGKILPKEDVEK